MSRTFTHPEVRVVLNRRLGQFTLTTGYHQQTHPIEKLGEWIETYDDLGARRVFMSPRSYDPTKHWATADAMRGLQERLGQKRHPTTKERTRAVERLPVKSGDVSQKGLFD